ncbi:hypothetical protein DFJ74DRAFT_678938 [Hyaloraphidium curvatum]|nr:hypothetical protein DFJ74DRAFT_678938 [Hyaloraphidium curvatum]
MNTDSRHHSCPSALPLLLVALFLGPAGALPTTTRALAAGPTCGSASAAGAACCCRPPATTTATVWRTTTLRPTVKTVWDYGPAPTAAAAAGVGQFVPEEAPKLALRDVTDRTADRSDASQITHKLEARAYCAACPPGKPLLPPANANYARAAKCCKPRTTTSRRTTRTRTVTPPPRSTVHAISGRIFFDRNRNGRFDPAVDEPLPDVETPCFEGPYHVGVYANWSGTYDGKKEIGWASVGPRGLFTVKTTKIVPRGTKLSFVNSNNVLDNPVPFFNLTYAPPGAALSIPVTQPAKLAFDKEDGLRREGNHISAAGTKSPGCRFMMCIARIYPNGTVEDNNGAAGNDGYTPGRYWAMGNSMHSGRWMAFYLQLNKMGIASPMLTAGPFDVPYPPNVTSAAVDAARKPTLIGHATAKAAIRIYPFSACGNFPEWCSFWPEKAIAVANATADGAFAVTLPAMPAGQQTVLATQWTDEGESDGQSFEFTV